MSRPRGNPLTIPALRRRRTEARRILAEVDAERAGLPLRPGDGPVFDRCMSELDWTARLIRELEGG